LSIFGSIIVLYEPVTFSSWLYVAIVCGDLQYYVTFGIILHYFVLTSNNVKYLAVKVLFSMGSVCPHFSILLIHSNVKICASLAVFCRHLIYIADISSFGSNSEYLTPYGLKLSNNTHT